MPSDNILQDILVLRYCKDGQNHVTAPVNELGEVSNSATDRLISPPLQSVFPVMVPELRVKINTTGIAKAALFF